MEGGGNIGGVVILMVYRWPLPLADPGPDEMPDVSPQNAMLRLVKVAQEEQPPTGTLH